MTERTKSGRKKPSARSTRGALRGRRRATRSVATSLGARAGANSLAALPWALGLLGASAVLAAASVFGR